jgi:hypothetical protein
MTFTVSCDIKGKSIFSLGFASEFIGMYSFTNSLNKWYNILLSFDKEDSQVLVKIIDSDENEKLKLYKATQYDISKFINYLKRNLKADAETIDEISNKLSGYLNALKQETSSTTSNN